MRSERYLKNNSDTTYKIMSERQYEFRTTKSAEDAIIDLQIAR